VSPVKGGIDKKREVDSLGGGLDLGGEGGESNEILAHRSELDGPVVMVRRVLDFPSEDSCGTRRSAWCIRAALPPP